jgi:predicted nucleic acid-binding protein
MIVISDTSPLTALLTVKSADILVQIFREVIIPEAVRDELLRSHTHLPGWLRVEPMTKDIMEAALKTVGE